MKAVILAGGLGTRLAEETVTKPKPMIEIGGKPLLWHIMTMYHAHGISDFVVCLGYRGEVIKDYFINYHILNANVTVDLAGGTTEIHEHKAEPWRITLVDTGADTMTGGRLNRIAPYVSDGTFCMTYGDGVSDVDISAAIRHHRSEQRLATVTAVRPPGRFGALNLDATASHVQSFTEKPEDEVGWINGGFFVLEPEALRYAGEGDNVIWEREPMERLATDGQLSAYRHMGFWQPCDTLRDKIRLEDAYRAGAPWLAASRTHSEGSQ
ncbi:MAG: glucose-1-phosphate cytidylyltransferase [Novosphingobium sp.]